VSEGDNGKDGVADRRDLTLSRHPARATARRLPPAYAHAVALDLENVQGLLWHGWLQQEVGNLPAAEEAYAVATDHKFS
jgi:hypothetical protein